MEQKNRVVLENPSGRGEIYCKKKLVAAVIYNLRVAREAPVTIPDGGPGLVDILGTVTVSQQERLHPDVISTLSSGDTLTLALNDGRKLDVRVSAEDTFSGMYRVTPAGPKGFYK
ncbi:MAG: hypothetical protein PHQ40_10400 [Anaerolineaceae bacterium]|nr:hypothetical protein [Anaerolineaceae bacterium]